MSGAGVPRTRPLDACPMCGSARLEPRFEEPDRLFGVPGTYRYVECAECATVFQSPRVVDEDLPLLYPKTYYTHEPPSTASGPQGHSMRGARDRVARRVRAAVRPGEGHAGALGRLLAASRWLRERAFRDHGLDELIPRTELAGRLLDVGCGTGAHMRLLGLLGWETEGLEWDAGAAEVARRLTGRPVGVGDVHTLAPGRTFDVVLMNSVFEHLPDPVRDLARMRELLTPGGRIVLVWPNPRGLGARRFGSAWYAWDPPRHLVIPPAAAVIAAAGRLGLEVRSWRTLTRGAATHAAYSRAIREGRAVRSDGSQVARSDRAFAWVERLLAPVDREAGEEVVMVLGRTG